MPGGPCTNDRLRGEGKLPLACLVFVQELIH
jgi:hypothetical protein